MRITHYQRLYFEVVNENGVNPEKANPLLKMLYKKLENLRYKKDSISARILDIDELKCQQITPNLLVGQYGILRWDIIDVNNFEWTHRYDNFTRNELAALLAKIEFKRYHTTLRITDVKNI